MDYGAVLFSKLVLQLHDCQKLHIASIFFCTPRTHQNHKFSAGAITKIILCSVILVPFNRVYMKKDVYISEVNIF